MKTAAAYIRVSTEDQVEYSPESQIKALQNYAKTHNLYLPEKFLFLDEGISGRSTKKRKKFVEMIALAKSTPKPFDVILVWKFSRFARNREDSVVYKSMLRKQYGIDVVSISENVGDDKMSVLFEAMIEAMDEYYSINLSEEVKRGMTEKAKRGGVLSIPAFGYVIKDGKFVIHPEQAEIIRKVFFDFLNGKGMLKIAKELNALNVRTNRGKTIENRTIEYWLNNPMYIGKTRWNPNGKTSRNYNAEGLIIVDDHEAIIDRDTWDAVQVKLKTLKEHYRKYTRDDKDEKDLSHWLTGLFRCGKCGAVMGHYSTYFGCNKKSRGICTGCGTISVHIAEKMVLQALKYVLADENVQITVLPLVKQNVNQPPSEHSILKQQLSKAEEKLRRVKEAYESGIDDLEEYKENKTKINSEIKEIKNKIKNLNKKQFPDPSGNNQRAGESQKLKIKRLFDILEDENISNFDKREILRRMIKEIVKVKEGSRELKIVFWEN